MGQALGKYKAVKSLFRLPHLEIFSVCGADESSYSLYSHLSNKREVKLTGFEKNIHPPLLVYSNLHIDLFRNLCTPSTVITTSSAIRDMRVRCLSTKLSGKALVILKIHQLFDYQVVGGSTPVFY